MRLIRVFSLVITALMLAACGSTPLQPDQGKTQNTPTPSPSSSPITASGLVDRLKAEGLPIGKVVIYTADTDQNHLLGRPHQYTGKVAWEDTTYSDTSDPNQKWGGSIEVFASNADLKARADYIKALGASPIFAEYDYTSNTGQFLFRLANELTPDQAAAYAAKVKALYPDLQGP